MPANQGWELGAVRTVFISDVHLGSRHSQRIALLSPDHLPMLECRFGPVELVDRSGGLP